MKLGKGDTRGRGAAHKPWPRYVERLSGTCELRPYPHLNSYATEKVT